MRTNTSTIHAPTKSSKSQNRQVGIFERLKADHRQLKDYCKQITAADDASSDEVQGLFNQFRELLVLHSKAEEQVFYRPLKLRSAEEGNEEVHDDVLEGFEEHHVAELLLNEISATDPSDERWMAKMNVLYEMLKHHIEEEEKDLFKGAREELERAELLQIGSQFEEEKEARSKLLH